MISMQPNYEGGAQAVEGRGVGIHMATVEDVPRLLHLASAFYAENAEAGYLDPFSSDFWCRYWSSLIDANLGILLYCTPSQDPAGPPVGLLAATVSLSHTDGALQVTEGLWYMEDGYRKGSLARRLVQALETFALGAEAKRVAMTHLVDETGMRLSKLFKRWGYKPFEVGYMKEVGHMDRED